MRQVNEQATAQVVERFHDRLADLAEQKTFQARHTLAIVHAHLREQPMRFAAAASTAVTDGRRPVRAVTKPRRRARRELARLQHDARADEVVHLSTRASRRMAGG